MCCFLVVRQEHVYVNAFFYIKACVSRHQKSLDYLNRRKILYIYVDITVLI